MGQANTSVWITCDTHHTGPHVGMAPRSLQSALSFVLWWVGVGWGAVWILQGLRVGRWLPLHSLFTSTILVISFMQDNLIKL